MVLAVLETPRRGQLLDSDVYAATVGGMRLVGAGRRSGAGAGGGCGEGDALPADLVVLGEVGLAGEIRRVTGVGQRLAEAARLRLHDGAGAAGSRAVAGRDQGAGGA